MEIFLQKKGLSDLVEVDQAMEEQGLTCVCFLVHLLWMIVPLLLICC
uniref:Uncharacterized protein n=1 Tax=Triticum urartu TaxID=4572 RepID=A0A8R7QD76_TRIUA